MTDLAWVVAPLAVLLIAALKGAFGGGLAILGIPMLALVMDPVQGGALLAPLFVVMDLCALRYWRPSTWSARDLAVLLPGLLVGVGLGAAALAWLPGRWITLAMAVTTLLFAGRWFLGGGRVEARARSTPLALTAGTAAGLTTMVAHAGGPPLAMYLLPLGLPKVKYVGTTSLFFTVGNLLKVVPWLVLARPSPGTWWLMAACVPFAPLGVWLGQRLFRRLDELALYRLCYGLLVLAGCKLLWDGLLG